MIRRIVVLGMHRSGTSVLTRLLGFAGCHLGDEGDFNPVRDDNPAGDWERRDVWSVNEAALEAADATWCSVAGLDIDGIDPERRTELGSEAARVVRRLDERAPWAIKDPRLCVTLPLWRTALEPAAIVILHRRPLDVARSLARRDGFPLAVGLALWEVYELAALEHTRDLPRVSLSHRRLMHDPVAAMAALGRDLAEVGVDGLTDPDADAVRGFVDPRLVHDSDDGSGEALTGAQARLAVALEDGSAFERGDLAAPSESARDLLHGYFASTRAIENLEGRLRETTELLSHKAQEVERLAEARDQAEDHAQRREATARELELQAQAAGRENRRLTAEVARLQRTVPRLEAAERDLDALLMRAAELQRLFESVLASRRWRFGDRAGRLADGLSRRPAPVPATEHLRGIVSELDALREAVMRRRDAEDD